MKPTHKKNMKRVRPLRNWISKAKGIRQKGGFAFLIPLLIAAGMSAGTAATAASAIGAAAGAAGLGAAGAVGTWAANKAVKSVGGGVRRPTLKIPTARRAMRIR